MLDFIKRIELWFLFGLTTVFNLTINGSDFEHLSGRLAAAGLLILLFCPKIKKDGLLNIAILGGAALRIILFIQFQQHGWLEHSTTQGALIASIALLSVFDGAAKHIGVASLSQLVILISLMIIMYLGMQFAPGTNYALGAVLCLLPLSRDNFGRQLTDSKLPAIISGFIIGWYVNEQSVLGVTNYLAFASSVILIICLSFKQYVLNGPLLVIGVLLGHGYCQRQQFIWVFVALVLLQIRLMFKPVPSDK